MGLQSWMIKSWPIIEWKVPSDIERWPTLFHAHTNVRDDAHDAVGGRKGDTVWIGVVDGKSVAAAWEWTELRPGVVMISDPNSIVTNIRFLDEDDTYQEYLPSLVTMNRLAHVLEWQPTVAAILAGARTPTLMPSDDAGTGPLQEWPALGRMPARAAWLEAAARQ